jgi:hypothetical protein
MPDEKRFPIGSGSDSFYLPETTPWNPSSPHAKTRVFATNQPFRVGSRSVAKAIYDVKDKVEQLNKDDASRTRIVKGHKVHVSAEMRELDHASYVVADTWLEALGNLQEFDLSEAVRTLDETTKQISYELPGNPSFEPAQEFVEVKLPKFLAQQLTSERAAALVKRHRSGSIYKDIETAKVTQEWLMLGPEAPGTIEGVVQYVKSESTDSNRDAVFSSFSTPRVIPFVFIATLLLTWLAPLRVWSVVGVSAVVLVLSLIAIYPARTVGWAAAMRQTETIACLGFFGVCVFGIAYAICGLTNETALGVVDSLGYPFLVSTSVGIAGGVLGDPKGVIRVLIHVQLLLLVAAFIKVLAILLRIERDVRRRG